MGTAPSTAVFWAAGTRASSRPAPRINRQDAGSAFNDSGFDTSNPFSGPSTDFQTDDIPPTDDNNSMDNTYDSGNSDAGGGGDFGGGSDDSTV